MKDICPGCGQEIMAEFDETQGEYVFVQHVHPRRSDWSENDDARWCEFSRRPVSH